MSIISIVGSGKDYNTEKIKEKLKDSYYIIACDGGLNLLHQLGISPDLILGDLDSVDKNILELYKNTRTIIYPTEKDLTDSEIALQKAIEMKPKKIYMLNVTGDYFDHSLANIYNLVRDYNKDIEIEIVTSNSTIFLIKDFKEFINLSGRRVSLFPLSKCEVILEGFKYNYNKKRLKFTDYSVSNVIEDNIATVSLKTGLILCILFDDKAIASKFFK
ncbi:MAG TPA: thiamine diphosphokinase [Spirochaetota bacterium]|nr:thiamine diphosphokinase [Spirochaetota bacterium]